LRFVKQSAQEKGLKVFSTFDGSVTTLQADERRLKQVLVNLLSNAVKFTPEGGSIGLEFVGDEEQQAVHFTVWDTGIGISEEQMPKLFQPFVQLDSKLSRRYSGTGLGLALVRRMVEMHGGSVSLESEVGQGSRFTASFPWTSDNDWQLDNQLHKEQETTAQTIQSPLPAIHQAGAIEDSKLQTPNQSIHKVPAVNPAQSDAPVSGRHAVGRAKVLLAEDNEANINTLSDYLVNKGYRVKVARNGAEAISRAREERPDVILMDIQMPEMDGLEATRCIRADVELATIPIIALTALAMPGDRERCLATGVNEYMSKPVSLKGLIKAIEAQLGQ
jgi:CheY-like chemotaxis protein